MVRVSGVVGFADMLVSRYADDDVKKDLVWLDRAYNSSGSSSMGVNWKSARVDADVGESGSSVGRGRAPCIYSGSLDSIPNLVKYLRLHLRVLA
jgi:hypothetical protein